MKKGFWEDFELNKEEYEDADWWFLDGQNGIEGELDGKGYNLFGFLHGDCSVFAQYLKGKYNYSVEAVFQGGQLVHMYCVEQASDGRKIYVDVRGKIDDWDVFIQEFVDDGLLDTTGNLDIRHYSHIPEKYTDQTEGKKALSFCESADRAYRYWEPEILRTA